MLAESAGHKMTGMVIELFRANQMKKDMAELEAAQAAFELLNEEEASSNENKKNKKQQKSKSTNSRQAAELSSPSAKRFDDVKKIYADCLDKISAYSRNVMSELQGADQTPSAEPGRESDDEIGEIPESFEIDDTEPADDTPEEKQRAASAPRGSSRISSPPITTALLPFTMSW